LELLTCGPAWVSGAHRTCTVPCPVCQYGLAWLLRAVRAFIAQQVAVGTEIAVAPESHRTVRWIIADQPLEFPEAGEFLRLLLLGAPDSPVNYSASPSGNSRRWRVRVGVLWCTGHCPVVHRTLSGVHRTVRCSQTRGPSVATLLLCWIQSLVFLLAESEPFTPV
jgi:hypothetical protein